LVRAVLAETTGANVEPYLLSLLAVVPELARARRIPADIAAALAVSREGDGRSLTLRVAHGVTDFLVRALESASSVVFGNVADADPTDREFIAVLVRRASAISVETSSGPEPLPGSPVEGARAFLAEFQPDLIFDNEAALLHAASERCMHLAYYDAALEWADVGRSLVDSRMEPDLYGSLTRNALFALLLLGRREEAETLCTMALEQCADPNLSVHVTYAKAMLNARFYDPARRDYEAARNWVEQSLAFTDRLPRSPSRAVKHAFLMNTKALVAMRQGQEKAALDLLDGALAYMAREAPEEYRRECIILLHNRARLNSMGAHIGDAIGDLSRLLEIEPSNSDAYFDRGLLYQRLEHWASALGDYDSAIRWSPPYWQPHFNRAQVLTALGRRAAAVADYDRVLVLNPNHLEALISRARLHLEAGELARAKQGIALALGHDAGNARGLCLRGIVAMLTGEVDAAEHDLSAAIAADPQLADAWANRATVYFKRGNLDAARADIDHALGLREDADILFNRDRILAACARRPA
jgi:tetratricopeptide (TPR) repeat protein